ncbi:glycosyltransferase [Actinomyces sp. W5033]|uniref:glycosyltransferase n=1 Tax=Actinomyces sp. W5033 TaxID=3446479 RepID=UPI003EE1F9DD
MSTHPSLREPHTRGTFPTRRSLTGPDGVLPQPRAQARPAAAVRTHLVVLIPAYQPDSRLPQLVTTLRRDLPGVQVLVVDDGSGPTWTGVFDEARERGAQVISYPVNAGKGHALRTGLARAAAAWPSADVVCADADGQHTPADIAAVARRVRESGRMTLGVREFTGKVPARSRIGNDVTALLFRGATGWRLRDTQTGLRGYPAGGYGWMLDVPGGRYEYELSALLRAHDLGLKVEQVGIETVYEPGNASSHFRPLQDSVRIYAPLLRFTGASLGSFVIDWVMVLALHALTGNLLAAVAGARMVSGAADFAMNRRVFRATGSLWRTGVRYVLLALGLVAASYLGLAALTGVGVPLALAKPVVDGVLYLASYTIQRRVVFRERR